MRTNEMNFSPFSWRREDVRKLDSIGETAPERDIVAVYSRRTGNSLDLRVDLLDLKYGSELEDLDLYILLGFGEGGNLQVPDGLGRARKPWKVAVKIYEGERAVVVDADGRVLGEAKVKFNSQLDTVITSIPERLLREVGWRGEKLSIEVLTAKDMEGKPSDRVVTSEDEEVHPLKLAFIFHGNQPIMRSSKIREKVFNPKDNTGFKRLLDTIERYQIPVELHISGLLQANFAWAVPELLKRIRELHRRGLLQLEGGTWGEHLMTYFTGSGVNQLSLRIGKALTRELTGKDPLVAWSPERVIDGKTLKEIREAGYVATIADYPALWFGDTSEPFKDTEANYKIHEVSSIPGMKVFFIDHVFQQETATNHDGGPSMRLRKHLIEQALRSQEDPHRLLISMNDWEFVAGFPFGQSNVPSLPDNFERNVRWIRSHPWLELTTPTKVLMENWPTIKHEVRYEDLKPQTYLQQDYHNLTDVLDRWYHGSSEDESYRDWIPLDRGWDFGGFKDRISTMKRMGDVFTPGTILGDTWSAIKNMRDSQIKELAELSFLTYIYETAWHDWSKDEYTGKRRISGWERDMAGQVRQIGILIEAAKWLEEVRSGKLKGERVYLRDLNMDGDLEGVLASDRAFVVVSPVGGKVVFAASYDPESGDAIPLLGTPLNMPTNEGEAQVNPYLKRLDPKASFHRLASFTDVPKDLNLPLEDTLYKLEVKDGAIKVIGEHLEKKFKLEGSTLTVSYLLKDNSLSHVLLGASPSPITLLREGRSILRVKRDSSSVRVRNIRGGEVIVKTDNATLSLPPNDIPLAREIRVTPQGSKFSVRVKLEV